MGCNTSVRKYRSWKDAKENWPYDVEVSRSESGNSYSGEIGMLTTKLPSVPYPLPFETGEEIEDVVRRGYDYIDDKHEKWDTMPIAVALPTGEILVGGRCPE